MIDNDKQKLGDTMLRPDTACAVDPIADAKQECSVSVRGRQ